MPPRTRVLVFLSLFALSVILWWHPLVAACRLALAIDAYTHILLILPLSLGLIFFGGLKSLSLQSPPGPRASAALLAVALSLLCYARWEMPAGHHEYRLSLYMLALVVWWIAGVWLCFGSQVFRALLFPLCFLFLMVPIPEFLLHPIVEFLQEQSASTARVMFQVVGVPVLQDGIMLSIPGLDIEVARECSSIRSSMMLVVTTLVFAHLFLSSWWRKTVLILAAIPVSVAKNGLRIVTIAGLGTRVDPAYLTGRLHRNGGFLFFALSVAVMAAILIALRRNEAPRRLSTLPSRSMM